MFIQIKKNNSKSLWCENDVNLINLTEQLPVENSTILTTSWFKLKLQFFVLFWIKTTQVALLYAKSKQVEVESILKYNYFKSSRYWQILFD